MTSKKKVLVLGSGPIIIGQGAEFDYSGTQCCLALKENGYDVVLANDNLATIMTDPEICDTVYCDPLTVKFVTKIIKQEKIDFLFATNGGQKALNLAIALEEQNVLSKYNVKVLGTSIKTIIASENRQIFASEMEKIGVTMLDSTQIDSIEQAKKLLDQVELPMIARPSYTLGGFGGGIAHSKEEFLPVIENALNHSPTHQCIIEKSIFGYQEIEYELMRDQAGNCVVVCNMENIDPVGIHTGDSMVVAPSLTINNQQYQLLRDVSIKILNHLDLVGGCNVQFALEPNTLNYFLIEINPRVSRSSALASKATGYPIARISSLLAIGKNLDEIINPATLTTTACFEPSLDYVVVKLPQFGFDKFGITNPKIGTQMQATGEVLGIGITFQEAFLKALASWQGKNKFILDPDYFKQSKKELIEAIKRPNASRIFQIFALLLQNVSPQEIIAATHIMPWFIYQWKQIAMMYLQLEKQRLDTKLLLPAKKMGFSDIGISQAWKCDAKEVFDLRAKNNIKHIYKTVDTCAAEFESHTPYFYSTYNGIENESKPFNNQKKTILIVGSGPIQIGQGIEFDYATCKAIFSLRELNYNVMVINNNPETVSTDYSISDKLFFEPINYEIVKEIYLQNKADGVLLQFGGQVALKLVSQLKDDPEINILGTSPESTEISEEKALFSKINQELEIASPKYNIAHNKTELILFTKAMNMPLILRPSFVIGGEGMIILYRSDQLEKYLQRIRVEHYPIIIEEYISGLEIEVDGVANGNDFKISGILEHIDKAGIHSGDSTLVFPSLNISDKTKVEIHEVLTKIVKKLKVVGLINAQFIYDKKLYLIEVNLRASRTLPFLYKATCNNIVKEAVDVICNRTPREYFKTTMVDQSFNDYYYIKAPVFSFQKIRQIKNIFLGPEMKSTGEAIGIDLTVKKALYKVLLSSGFDPFRSNNVILSVQREDKTKILEIYNNLQRIKYNVYATSGTYNAIRKHFNYQTPRLHLLKDDRRDYSKIFDDKRISFVINTRKHYLSDNDNYSLIIENALLHNITLISSIELAEEITKLIVDFKYLISPIMK